MKLDQFRLERYFAKYEFTAPYLLCSSDCESMELGDLLAFEPEAHERLLSLAKTGAFAFCHWGLPCTSWGSAGILSGGSRRVHPLSVRLATHARIGAMLRPKAW